MGGADVLWIMSFTGRYPALDLIGIFFAEYVAYFVLIILGIVLLLQRDTRHKLYLLFVTGLSLILSLGIIKTALNYFLYRPRPFAVYNITPLIEQPATASFPSGHATLLFTVATIVFLFLSRRWGGWLFVAATLVGVARVYAGVHYPLDIVGGAAIGILSPFIVRMLLPSHLSHKRHTTPLESQSTV